MFSNKLLADIEGGYGLQDLVDLQVGALEHQLSYDKPVALVQQDPYWSKPAELAYKVNGSKWYLYPCTVISDSPLGRSRRISPERSTGIAEYSC